MICCSNWSLGFLGGLQIKTVTCASSCELQACAIIASASCAAVAACKPSRHSRALCGQLLSHTISAHRRAEYASAGIIFGTESMPRLAKVPCAARVACAWGKRICALPTDIANDFQPRLSPARFVSGIS